MLGTHSFVFISKNTTSRAISIHFTPRLVIWLRSILILSFHLCPVVLIFYFLEFYWNFVCKIYRALIIIIILIITLMQVIYNHIPETNHVYSVYSVADVLYLQFILPVVLFRPWILFCTFTLALPAECVQCPKWLLSVFNEFRAFSVCCSGTVWVIMKWSQLYLLLPVLLLLPHSTCFEVLLSSDGITVQCGSSPP